jgi:hypothetical protein
MAINQKRGIVSLGILLSAFLVHPVCSKFLSDSYLCLLPYFFVLMLSLGVSIAAIIKENRYWAVVSGIALFLMGQTVLALLVE